MVGPTAIDYPSNDMMQSINPPPKVMNEQNSNIKLSIDAFKSLGNAMNNRLCNAIDNRLMLSIKRLMPLTIRRCH